MFWRYNVSIGIEKKQWVLQLYCQRGLASFGEHRKKNNSCSQLLETIVILVSGKQSREEKIEVALGDDNGWWDQQTVQIVDKFNRGIWGIRDTYCSWTYLHISIPPEGWKHVQDCANTWEIEGPPHWHKPDSVWDPAHTQKGHNGTCQKIISSRMQTVCIWKQPSIFSWFRWWNIVFLLAQRLEI